MFESDSIKVNSINTSEVLDGVIKLTVQVTDTSSQLIATKTVDYMKDTVLPKSYYSRSNLENDGTSSLDDFLINVVIESIDVGGEYNLDINPTSGKSSKASLSFKGSLNSETTSLENLALDELPDGEYEFELTITDPNGNKGEPFTSYYLKENGLIVETQLSLSEIERYGLTMFPNPASNHIFFESKANINYKQLTIYNIHGQEVKRINVNANNYPLEINVQGLAAGHYFIRLLINDQKQITKRFIKL